MKTGPGVKQTLLAQYSRSRDKEKQSLTCELRQQFSKQQKACGSRISSGGEWVGAVRDGDWRQMPGGNRRCWHPSGVAGLGDLLEMLTALALGGLGKLFTLGWGGPWRPAQSLWLGISGDRDLEAFFASGEKEAVPYCESEISVFKYNLCSSSESFTIQARHSSLEKQLLITSTHYNVSTFVFYFITVLSSWNTSYHMSLVIIYSSNFFHETQLKSLKTLMELFFLKHRTIFSDPLINFKSF